MEDGEAAIGDAGLAAPVYDHTGTVAGAIGLVGPVERPLGDNRSELAVAVRETARHLSRDLGSGRARLDRGGVLTPALPSRAFAGPDDR